MIDLQKEAEDVILELEGYSDGWQTRYSFSEVKNAIANFATNSKFVQAEKLKAQIEILGILNKEATPYSSMRTKINYIIITLQKHLITIENDTNRNIKS
jgi:hypothetical protein